MARSEALGRYTVQGTPVYLSPEAARGQACTKSDIWSVGIMLLQLTTGALPYDQITPDTDPMAVVLQIGSGRMRPKFDKSAFPEVTVQFVEGCLAPTVEQRLTAAELLELSFFFV